MTFETIYRFGGAYRGLALCVYGRPAHRRHGKPNRQPLFLGWLLVIAGIIQAVHAFWARRWGGIFAHLIAGVLSVVVGLLFLTRPTLAELALTLLVAVLLVVGGLFRMNIALLWRFPAWGWVVYDGVLSLVLGLVIWIAWPESALWVIGMLVGIDLLFKGWSCFMFALAARTA